MSRRSIGSRNSQRYGETWEIKELDFENIAKELKRHTPYADRVLLGARHRR